jgi:hypothetical protein
MKEYIFDGVNFSIIISTILIFLGWIRSTPYIFKLASFIVKVIVGLFLVVRFSFFKENPLSAFEKKVCFVSGMYLLVFTIGEYIREFVYRFRPWLANRGLLRKLE